MEHARSERGVDASLLEHVTEMFDGAGTARRNERNRAQLACRLQLIDVVTALHAIATHAVEHDLAGATILHFADPLKRIASRVACAVRIPGELIYAPALWCEVAVHANHYALGSEARAERIDERRVGEGRRVHGNLLGTRVEHGFGFRHGANAAGYAEWNVEPARHPPDPRAIHRAPFRACGDVVEHELV